ncbi:hypothetical protein [Flavobacterium sp. N2038]|uniref:hypothetical protein n=1 Tax=Flavobacterium sp. N2038 TaxID=2986829 RepID=UPI00222541D0|nr:hypothetical protein [Flavobacterium sp. N2038]
MKKISLLLLLVCTSIYSQKTELTPVEFYVNYQDLPSVYVPVALRTFNVKVKTAGSIEGFKNTKQLADYIKLYGWKRATDSATVNVEVNLLDFQKKNEEIEKKTVEEKNRDGILERAFEMFTIVTNYTGNGNAKITYFKLENSKKTAIDEELNFSKTIPYKSVENHDLPYLQAQNKKNETAYYNKRLGEYVESSLNQVKNKLNDKFGFTAINLNEQLLILVSKEEGETYKTTIDQVAKKLSEMKADAPINNVASELEPSIKYLESLKEKYSGSSKTNKTIRYSVHYNLAKIYLYLDQPEKTIVEGEALIKNGFKKEDGESLVETGKKLLNKFNTLNVRSTHNEINK